MNHNNFVITVWKSTIPSEHFYIHSRFTYGQTFQNVGPPRFAFLPGVYIVRDIK